jgi:hypothetical protein
LEHVIADQKRGPFQSRRQHFEEWVRLVEPQFGRIYGTEEQVDRRVSELMQMNYSIHFHNWDPDGFREFLDHVASTIPISLELFVPFDEEMVAIVRKRTF